MAIAVSSIALTRVLRIVSGRIGIIVRSGGREERERKKESTKCGRRWGLIRTSGRNGASILGTRVTRNAGHGSAGRVHVAHKEMGNEKKNAGDVERDDKDDDTLYIIVERRLCRRIKSFHRTLMSAQPIKLALLLPSRRFFFNITSTPIKNKRDIR